MTPEQIALVQTSFERVAPNAEAVAALFYQRLFELDPAARGLFKGDMRGQGGKLMAMLAVVVRGLTRLDRIVPAIESLGQRHVAYGVQDSHYATVGSALLWTLEQGLGPDFTPETREAWTAAYTLLATTMQQAAARATVAAQAAD